MDPDEILSNQIKAFYASWDEDRQRSVSFSLFYPFHFWIFIYFSFSFSFSFSIYLFIYFILFFLHIQKDIFDDMAVDLSNPGTILTRIMSHEEKKDEIDATNLVLQQVLLLFGEEDKSARSFFLPSIYPFH